MPQLDLIIIFPQIFWFFVLFIFFYTITLHYILPKFLLIFKVRKFIIVYNTNEILKLTNKAKNHKQRIIKYINKSLFLINNISKKNIIMVNDITNLQEIDIKLTKSIKELNLYYNKYIFNLINLRNKNFNYK